MPQKPLAAPSPSRIITSRTPERACAFVLPAAFIIIIPLGGAIEHVKNLTVFSTQLPHARRPGFSYALV